MTTKIHSEIDLDDARPPWDESKWRGHAYKVTLRHDGRQMTVPFFCGEALGWPTTRDVVECLASDFFCFDTDYSRDFEDFCSNLGYDTDSRKAEKQYKDGLKQTKQFVRFIGPALEGWLRTEGDSELFAKRYSAEED